MAVRPTAGPARLTGPTRTGGTAWDRSATAPAAEDQLANREVKATSVGAWSTSLVAIYETDPDVIAAVLPPPLEPTDEPLVRVTVATVDMGDRACRRSVPAPFAVVARHEGTDG